MRMFFFGPVWRIFWVLQSENTNKIWALHHMTRETAVTQKDDAVALKARTVLSTSVNTEVLQKKKKVKYHEKGLYFLSLLSESETHILYKFITHRVKYVKPFVSWHFDDYGLQIMKTQNAVSQKIWILHNINKKGYFKQKYQASEKYVHFYALNTCLGLLLL